MSGDVKNISTFECSLRSKEASCDSHDEVCAVTSGRPIGADRKFRADIVPAKTVGDGPGPSAPSIAHEQPTARLHSLHWVIQPDHCMFESLNGRIPDNSLKLSPSSTFRTSHTSQLCWKRAEEWAASRSPIQLCLCATVDYQGTRCIQTTAAVVSWVILGRGKRRVAAPREALQKFKVSRG